MSNLTLYDTQCCAIQEMSGLKYYGGSTLGKDAMLDFCAKVLSTYGTKYRSFPGRTGKIYSFYMFTSEEYKATGGSSSFGGDSYGTMFANFILENKLGELVETPIKKNEAFHDDHWNRVWIWSPDLTALKAWYAEAKVQTPAAKPAAIVDGQWDTVLGIAGSRCSHCDALFVRGTPTWYDKTKNLYYCAAYGKELGK